MRFAALDDLAGGAHRDDLVLKPEHWRLRQQTQEMLGAGAGKWRRDRGSAHPSFGHQALAGPCSLRPHDQAERLVRGGREWKLEV